MAADRSKVPAHRSVLVVLVLTCTQACTTVTFESYRPVENRNVDIAYVAASADFGKYRRLQAEEMGIFYPTHAPASEEDLQRVRGAFRDAFLGKISDYEIVDQPGADVLKVRASLVDLRNTAADRLPNIADDLNEILEPGKLTFLIEMRDSTTDNLLLRAADTQKSPDVDLPDGGPMSDDIRDAAAYWAELFKNFLDTNLNADR